MMTFKSPRKVRDEENIEGQIKQMMLVRAAAMEVKNRPVQTMKMRPSQRIEKFWKRCRIRRK